MNESTKDFLVRVATDSATDNLLDSYRMDEEARKEKDPQMAKLLNEHSKAARRRAYNAADRAIRYDKF